MAEERFRMGKKKYGKRDGWEPPAGGEFKLHLIIDSRTKPLRKGQTPKLVDGTVGGNHMRRRNGERLPAKWATKRRKKRGGGGGGEMAKKQKKMERAKNK